MKNIKRLSKGIRWFFQLAVFVTPIFFIMFCLCLPQKGNTFNYAQFAVSFLHPGIDLRNATLTMSQISLVVAITFVAVILGMVILWQLRQLFYNFEQGKIFTQQNIERTYTIGKLILMKECYAILQQPLLTLILSWYRPHGYRTIAVGIGGEDLQSVLLALIIIVVSWIMKQAFEYQEELELTV